jgi:DNA polymerase-3 subunit delta'
MSRLFGHDRQLAQFAKAANSGRLHHGWILSGPRGVGKASFAREMARQLIDPLNHYSSMIEQRSHPDIVWVQRLPKELPKDGEPIDPDAELKRSISIDQIREVQHRLTTRPSMADKRIVIIDAADDLERGGANALLKSLEEPPQGTYFLLISHMSDRLLPTIRSRCQMLRFDPLSDNDMTSALNILLPDAGSNEIAALVRTGRGAPGEAIQLSGIGFDAIEQLAEDILTKGDSSNQIRMQIAEKLSLKAAQSSYEAFLRYVPGRIARAASDLPVSELPRGVEAFQEADRLAARAIGLSLDKQAVLLQMGHLLASLAQRG